MPSARLSVPCESRIPDGDTIVSRPIWMRDNTMRESQRDSGPRSAVRSGKAAASEKDPSVDASDIGQP